MYQDTIEDVIDQYSKQWSTVRVYPIINSTLDKVECVNESGKSYSAIYCTLTHREIYGKLN